MVIEVDRSPDPMARDISRSVARLENLEDEIRDLNDEKVEVYRQAKRMGLDPKTLKKLLKRRRMSASDIREEGVLLTVYEAALTRAEDREE